MGNMTTAMLKAEAYDPKKINHLGPDMAVLNSLMEMIILDACSFMDEYNKYLGVITEESYKQKIVNIKTICKPLVTQINKWSDLRLIRNSLIAHNRKKDKALILSTQMDYKAPRGPYEVELLNNIIQVISHIIKKEFQYEIDYAKKNFELNIPKFKSFSKDDCWREMDSLVKKTNQNLKKFNKSYLINLK